MTRTILRIKGNIIIVRMRIASYMARAWAKSARRVYDEGNLELAKKYVKVASKYDRHFLDLTDSVLEISRKLH